MEYVKRRMWKGIERERAERERAERERAERERERGADLGAVYAED